MYVIKQKHIYWTYTIALFWLKLALLPSSDKNTKTTMCIQQMDLTFIPVQEGGKCQVLTKQKCYAQIFSWFTLKELNI